MLLAFRHKPFRVIGPTDLDVHSVPTLREEEEIRGDGGSLEDRCPAYVSSATAHNDEDGVGHS